MGKRAQRRRHAVAEERAPRAGAEAMAKQGASIPRWAVPAATIAFAAISYFVFDSAAIAGSIALLGLLASIATFAAGLEKEIPPSDRGRTAGINFGRKQ